ncbi:MAG: carbamoyltransferase [Candidatus Hydrogenedentes bacterium]|nr:carbamoyltransferase [Candidatus Hydrogenedentota bacterium]
MNILGIGGYSHDSAAALVCDGKLVAAVAEERLSRIKHAGGIPHRAVAWCLEEAGLTADDVDHIGAYMRPGFRLARRLPYRARQVFRAPLYSGAYAAYELAHNVQYISGIRALRGRNTRVHFMEHHPAHAASAFLVSPFDSAALLSVDYVGEWAATWMGVGQGTGISRLDAINYPHSLGVLYSGVTDYLGFLRASDEYKVMGLASYGSPEYADVFRKIVRLTDGGYKLDLSWLQAHYKAGSREGYFSRKFLKTLGPPRKKGETITSKHENIAASAQLVLEETVLHLAKVLHQRTGQTKLCLAGGVALNCSMNGRLLRESPFDEIYVHPAAGDDGIAVGAAYQLHHRFTKAPREYVMRDARLGPAYSDADIERTLEHAKLSWEKAADPATTAAGLLAQGRIIGWFQNRMEWGPRALGARSILADPTRPDMKDLLNKYVKHREEFRPFAPSCLEEAAGDYFEDCATSPFMLFVHKVKPAQQARVPAITHVDGTARVQTVNRDAHPQYHALISAFEKLRGVPMVLNTSFNVMGEPIVNTPSDALRCFFSTGMDALVMGGYVVVKQ